jgi:hypothetical protein
MQLDLVFLGNRLTNGMGVGIISGRYASVHMGTWGRRRNEQWKA